MSKQKKREWYIRTCVRALKATCTTAVPTRYLVEEELVVNSASTFSPRHFQRRLRDHADNPSITEATRKRGFIWAFQWCAPTAHTSSFARALLCGATRKKCTPALILCSPVHELRCSNSLITRIVVRCCCSCLPATFTFFFGSRFERKLRDHAGSNPSKDKSTRKRGFDWAFQ